MHSMCCDTDPMAPRALWPSRVTTGAIPRRMAASHDTDT
jgi:hypothetical protein